MNILTVGNGEIGKSIQGLYKNKDKYDLYYYDLKGSKLIDEQMDIMHICIPYTKTFINDVILFIERWNPKLAIIHSTVFPGVTRKISNQIEARIVHSPCMGKHPHLTKSLRTFRKIVGGCSDDATKATVEHLAELGVKSEIYNSPEESEMAKLLDTTYFAWVVYYMQHIHELCEKQGVDFENVYTKTNEIYNEGYTELGDTQFIRPILKFIETGISGHCLIENSVILDEGEMIPTIVKPILVLGKPKKK